MPPCMACEGEQKRCAVATWTYQNGNVIWFCARHLDMWLDMADEDPTMEPVQVRWLDGSRALVGAA